MRPVDSLTAPLDTPPREQSSLARVQEGFGRILEDMVQEVESRQRRADLAIQDLHTGGATNIHEVMIALEEAEISMRLFVQVRNKALEAYQEIMRMQV